MVKLGEVFKITSGGTPEKKKIEYYQDGTIPWVKTGDLKEMYVTDKVECITELGLKNSSAKLFPKGTVLIAMYGATIGACSILSFEATTNQACAAFLPNDELLPEYLYYFLSSKKESFIKDGVGGAQPNISAGYLKNVEILKVAVEKQRAVIGSLSRIENVITRRKQQLQKLDELVKARFVEMFGDPISNPKGWNMPLIEDIVAKEKNALKAGPFGSALKKEYYVDSGYKIYGQEQVINGDHKFGDYYIDTERYKLLKNCAVKAGDVLISLVGTCGKSYVMPEEFEPGIINPRLMKITFDKEKINPYYFQHYFQSDSLKKALAENTHGGTMDILNLSIVRKLTVPLPPLELQNEFISLVKQIDKSKLSVQKSLEKLEILKKALMQKYFG